MLVIRSTQRQAFAPAALQAFETDMVAHLSEFSPPLFKAVGEEQMRKVVRLGIAQAGRYGLTYRGPVRLYLEIMLLLGSHFDTDPQYSWSAGILNDAARPDQMDRADRLYEEILSGLETVVGPNDAYAQKALRAIAVFAREPLPLSSDDFVPGMLERMMSVYPEKAAYVGTEGLTALIREGITQARKHHFVTVRAAALIVVLMFAFGHGCVDDPLYPWIARTLHDERLRDPVARAQRLEKKSLTWLEHVLATSEPGTEA